MSRINFVVVLGLFAVLFAACNKSYEAEPEPTPYVPPTNTPPPAASILDPKEYTENGYTVVFKNTDPLFSPETREKMVRAFFTVYPKLVSRFNPGATRTVTFLIDQNYAGAAYASGGITTYSAGWMRNNPNDIDIVSHEIMHIVQSYPSGAGPGWLTEGIADYARYKYGVDNAGGGWSLPDYNSGQSYTNSYRVTARFLAWLEIHVRATMVTDLNSAMYTKTYSTETWTQLTGKTVDELWQSYSQKPTL